MTLDPHDIIDELRAASMADPRPQHRQASEIGMTQSSYSAVLAGRNTRLDTLCRMAEGLGLEVRLARPRRGGPG
jgi:transcriptional regulator with XRE-family HTH domain